MFRVSISLSFSFFKIERDDRERKKLDFYGSEPLLFCIKFNKPKLVTEIYENYFIVYTHI